VQLQRNGGYFRGRSLEYFFLRETPQQRSGVFETRTLSQVRCLLPTVIESTVGEQRDLALLANLAADGRHRSIATCNAVNIGFPVTPLAGSWNGLGANALAAHVHVERLHADTERPRRLPGTQILKIGWLRARGGDAIATHHEGWSQAVAVST
jgi:hypothetical protein